MLRQSHPHVEVAGPHELAWSVMLDSVFADAFHAGVRNLTVSLSHSDLMDHAKLRAELTPTRGDRTAILCQTFDMLADPIYDLAYTIEHGGVLGGAIQKRQLIASHSWTARQQTWVYTWRSRLIGIPIRIANMMGRADQVDRQMRRMRGVFVSRKPTISYYHLTVWERLS